MSASQLVHPAWCEPDRCTAAAPLALPRGIHRSAAMPANPAGDEAFQLELHLELHAGDPAGEVSVLLTATADGLGAEILPEGGRRVLVVMDVGQAGVLRAVLGDVLMAAIGRAG